MIPERAQVSSAADEDPPMSAPTFAEEPFAELAAGFEADQIRRNRGHIRLQLAAIKAAIFRLMIEKVFHEVWNGGAIEHGEEPPFSFAEQNRRESSGSGSSFC